MKNIKSVILLLPFLMLSHAMCRAQQTPKTTDKEYLRINEFFNTFLVEDSTGLYAFAFKATVKKNKKGVAEVISLSASDSVAYRIYPNYKFLNTVNYALFMKNKQQVSFVFPVALQVYGSKKELDPKFEDSLDKFFMFLGRTKKGEKDDITDQIFFPPALIRVDKTVYR